MRIELAFWIKADLLLRMQALYDNMVIRVRAGKLNARRYQPERAQEKAVKAQAQGFRALCPELGPKRHPKKPGASLACSGLFLM